MGIQRYLLWEWDDGRNLTESNHGDIVLYQDHLEIVESLEYEIRYLTETIEEYKNLLTNGKL